MKLRALLFIIVASFLTITVNAQVFVAKMPFAKYVELEKERYDNIKKRKTIFVLDDYTHDEFYNMLKDIWTLNDFEVIDSETFEANKATYITENNAIFKPISISGYTGSNVAKPSFQSFIYMSYFYPENVDVEKDGDVKFKVKGVTTIYLSGYWEDIVDLGINSKSVKLTSLTNYKLGYLKNYFQFINNCLTKEKSFFGNEDSCNITELRKLKKQVLYIPEYIKINQSSFAKRGKPRANVDEIFDDYPYKYQYISDAELNAKILEGGKDSFYYVSCLNVASNKQFSIINGLTGEIIYNNYSSLGWNLKSKDLAKVVKKIKKGK